MSQRRPAHLGHELVVRRTRLPERPVELRLRVQRTADVAAAPKVEVVRGHLEGVHLWDVVEQVMDVFPLGAIGARH